MVENEGIQIVVDLREESQACESSDPSVTWVKIPLGDNATVPEHTLFAQAIQAVVAAYHQERKWHFIVVAEKVGRVRSLSECCWSLAFAKILMRLKQWQKAFAL